MKIPHQLRGLLGSDRPAAPVPPAPPVPTAPTAPTPAPPPPAARVDPTVLAILETGAFDQEWYQAQTGLSFPSRQAAVKHYLGQGRSRRFSPHPLFEPELTDPQWNKRDKDPLLHFLATGDFRAHPLFQDAELEQHEGEHQGQRWLRWIHSSTPDTAVPGQPSTWGQLRSAMLAAAAQWRHDEEAATGARWVDRVSLLPDPTPTEPEDEPDVDDLAPEHDDGDAEPDAFDALYGESGEPDDASDVVVEEPPALVSVVLTASGPLGDLRASLDSILAQHYPTLEVIAVLPADPDAAGVDDLLVAGDDRVRVVRSEVAGTAAFRALGLEQAAGRYVAFVDAGTRWFPFHLHHLVAALEQNGWDLAHGVVKDAAASRYRSFAGGYEHLLHGNAIDLASLLVSRDLLTRVGGLPGGSADLDYATVLRLAHAESPHAVRVLSLEREVTADEQTPPVSDQRVALEEILARAAEPVSGRVSLVVPARHFNRALTPMAALAGPDVEVIVVGIRTRVQRCLAAGALAAWPVRFVGWSATDNWSFLATLGLAAATGEKLVLLRQGAALNRTVVDRLVAALDEPGVAVAQPLNRDPGDSIASFGAGFPEHVRRRRVLTPFPLLQGYAASIVRPGSPRTVPAAWSEAVGVRRDHLLALGGLDPALGNDFAETDLSLTLGERGYGSTVCLPDLRLIVRPGERFGFSQNLAHSARVLHSRHEDAPGGTLELLGDAGLQVTGWSASPLPGGEDDPVQWSMLPRLAHRVPVSVSEGLPALWWAIDTASPAGPVGDQWGDTHFAESLAVALRRIGQTVSVDRREARGRTTRPDDDVTLVMRGLHRVDPLPNQVSMLWLISHPESVTRDELVDYDVVYAASVPWARRKSADWGLEIEPMLQCTDPELFNPGRAEPDSGPRVAWVGKSRGIDRPVLRMAITAGARPVVYGTDWKRFIDPSLITAEYLDNDLVGELYAAAGVVLNDHWEDMQRDGFLANRLFDAVACGSRVISDPVEGIEELFGGSVRTVDGQADMDRLLSGTFDEWFADRETRLENAARVASEHSFDARARTLVEAAARRIAAR